jgi:hypothetical protein
MIQNNFSRLPGLAPIFSLFFSLKQGNSRPSSRADTANFAQVQKGAAPCGAAPFVDPRIKSTDDL